MVTPFIWDESDEARTDRDRWRDEHDELHDAALDEAEVAARLYGTATRSGTVVPLGINRPPTDLDAAA